MAYREFSLGTTHQGDTLNKSKGVKQKIYFHTYTIRQIVHNMFIVTHPVLQLILSGRCSGTLVDVPALCSQKYSQRLDLQKLAAAEYLSPHRKDQTGLGKKSTRGWRRHNWLTCGD